MTSEVSSAAAQSSVHPPSVSVCVASMNTARATELCIRSARHFAGYPFTMHVGDCGSTDGSIDMLRAFEARGWISLEVAPSGRFHSVWLDQWLHTCDDDLVVFVDSDIEFRRPGWLLELVDKARTTDAALVTAEMLPEVADFPAPRGGMSEEDRAEMLDRWFDGHEIVRLASRPAPWLLLLDLRKVRPLGLSFAYELRPAPDLAEGIIAFDVGGGLFRRVQGSDLGWEVMPDSYQAAYHHYGGLSWVPLKGRRGLKKRRDLVVVAHRLCRIRRVREGADR